MSVANAGEGSKNPKSLHVADPARQPVPADVFAGVAKLPSSPIVVRGVASASSLSIAFAHVAAPSLARMTFSFTFLIRLYGPARRG